MLNLTPQGQALVQDLALRYAVSQDAVLNALQALLHGRPVPPDPALKANDEALYSHLTAVLAAHESTDETHNPLYISDTSRQTVPWWPFTLGAPSASGSQNDVSYAYFPSARRLAIEFKGHVTLYDTGEHRLSALCPQPGDLSAVTLISQQGVFPLTDLPVVSSDGVSVAQSAAPSVPIEREDLPPAASSGDLIVLIERLAQLKDKSILTDEEFTAKKSELLRRL